MASSKPIPGSAANYEVGGIASDFTDHQSQLRAIVKRGLVSWCAYVGAPNEHPLQGLEELRFSCHFGITWSAQGDGIHLPSDYYWWGWDYAHFTDALIWPAEVSDQTRGYALGKGRKTWTVDEIVEDALDVLMALRTAIQDNATLAQHTLQRVAPQTVAPWPPGKDATEAET